MYEHRYAKPTRIELFPVKNAFSSFDFVEKKIRGFYSSPQTLLDCTLP